MALELGACCIKSHLRFSTAIAFSPKQQRISFTSHKIITRRLRAAQEFQQQQRLQRQMQEEEDERVGFLDRLGQAWEILFPATNTGRQPNSISNAEIAKQRLKMILISDRCSITDDAKKKIVDNIVGALADFVEIESEEKVQLNVVADPELGTVYSVTVPVRRVKPEYQDFSREIQQELQQQGFELGCDVRTVGIRFDSSSGQKVDGD